MSQKVSFTPALIDRIGPIGRVLEDFLSQQVRAVQAALEGKWRGISHSAAKRVLNEFVSLEGTKKPQSAQEFQALGVNEAQKLFILQQLEKSRILTESDGIYEVAHDTLAKRLQADEFAEFKDLVTHATEVGKTDMFTVDSDKPAQELEHCIKILTRCSVPLPNIKPLVGYCKPGKFHAHWGDTIFASDLEDLLAAYDYPADEGRTTD